MPCYTPLDAYEYLSKKQNGKAEIIFKRPVDRPFKEIQLPCGQCIGCRLSRSITWATRIMHEVQTTHNETACFITVTYDDKHLPKDHSLNKDHFVKFLKRFRAAIKPIKIRYFMCGEYGDLSYRPHYHAIIFGYDFTSGIKYKKEWCERRKQIQMSEVGNPYYIAPLLTKLWTYGNHIVTECTWDTAAYVARYCTKKITGEQAEKHYNRIILDGFNEFTGEFDRFQEVNLEPEYATMSRRPGIGLEWFKKYKSDCYPSNFLIQDGHKTPIPKYYDKKFEAYCESLNLDDFKKLKDIRQKALKKAADDLTPERLEQRHYTKKQQYKTLMRNKI